MSFRDIGFFLVQNQEERICCCSAVCEEGDQPYGNEQYQRRIRRLCGLRKAPYLAVLKADLSGHDSGGKRGTEEKIIKKEHVSPKKAYGHLGDYGA